MIELKFVFEIGVELDHLEEEWVGEDTDIYVGNDWKDCCEQSAKDWEYDDSGFPTNEDGTKANSRKDLMKILQKSEEGECIEVPHEVYNYYYDKKNFEINLDSDKKVREQFFDKD